MKKLTIVILLLLVPLMLFASNDRLTIQAKSDGSTHWKAYRGDIRISQREFYELVDSPSINSELVSLDFRNMVLGHVANGCYAVSGAALLLASTCWLLDSINNTISSGSAKGEVATAAFVVSAGVAILGITCDIVAHSNYRISASAAIIEADRYNMTLKAEIDL